MISSGVIRTYHKKDCNHAFCHCDEKNGFQLKLEYFQNAGKIEGIYKEYYYNGEIWQKVNYINNLKEGVYKTYYISGQLYEEVNYINGKREGIYKAYHRNGQTFGECNYIDDKVEGKHIQYFASGNIENESNYNNNKLNGEYKSYLDNINRQIIKKLNYVNGNEEGLQIYYKNDEEYAELLYINNKISSFETHGNKIAKIHVIFNEPIEYELLEKFVDESYLEQYHIYF